MPGGRPSKFTAEVRERILQAVSVGVPLELACKGAGISYAALRVWIRRGERQKRGQFAQFVRAIDEAEVRALTRWMAIIDKAAQEGSWVAAAWKAERRFPEFFGRQRIEVTGRDGQALKANIHIENRDLALRILNDPKARDLAHQLAVQTAPNVGLPS